MASSVPSSALLTALLLLVVSGPATSLSPSNNSDRDVCAASADNAAALSSGAPANTSHGRSAADDHRLPTSDRTRLFDVDVNGFEPSLARHLSAEASIVPPPPSPTSATTAAAAADDDDDDDARTDAQRPPTADADADGGAAAHGLPPPPSSHVPSPPPPPPATSRPVGHQDRASAAEPAEDTAATEGGRSGLAGRLQRELSALAGRGGRLAAARLTVGGATLGSPPRNSTMALWAACVGLLAILVVQRSRRHKYDLDLIPGPWTHALPFIGNILQVLRPDFHRVLLRWADKYGGIVRIRFLWYNGVMVTDPAALATICGRGEGSVDKAAELYTPISQMCTAHGDPNLLTSVADESWRAVRKAVALSFAFGNIRKKFSLIRDRTSELVEWLRRKGPKESVDVDQAALRVTLDVIGLSAFGHDYGCTRLDAVPYDHLLRVLPRAFTEVMRRIANPFRVLAPWWFKNGVKGRQSFVDFQAHMRHLLREIKERGPPPRGDTDIGAQLYRVLQTAKQEAEKNPAARRGWWQRLLRRGPPPIDDERILSEIGILFVEGFETTGHTISWTLFNIATAPGVQEAVAEELGSLGLLVRGQAEGGRSAARPLELDDLKRLRYLTACTKEAMRMYPVVSIMARFTTQPTRVGPYLVPRGTPVATPLFAIHNTVHNWKDPLEFRPERWMDVPLESYVLDLRSKEGIAPNGTAATAATAATKTAPASAKPAATTPSERDAPAGPLESSDRVSPSVARAATAAPAGAAAAATSAAGPSPLNGAVARSISWRIRAEPSTSPSPPLHPQQQQQQHQQPASSSSSGADAASDDDDDGAGSLGGPTGRKTGISFMPFSEGPRSCVGQSLAKLEVMTVLAMILANFRIELAEEMGGREGVRQRESTHLTLQTKGTRGIRMHLHPRDQEP